MCIEINKEYVNNYKLKHPCAETDIDRLDEIERYIDTLKE